MFCEMVYDFAPIGLGVVLLHLPVIKSVQGPVFLTMEVDCIQYKTLHYRKRTFNFTVRHSILLYTSDHTRLLSP